MTQSSILERLAAPSLSSLENDLRLELRFCVLLVLVLICGGKITLTVCNSKQSSHRIVGVFPGTSVYFNVYLKLPLI